MAYTTAATIRKYLLGVSTLTMDDPDVTSWITRAQYYVDGILSVRFSVPFATCPPRVQQLTEDVACYLIMRTLFTKDGVNVNEWADKFKEAKDTLIRIAERKERLLTAAGAEVAERKAAISNTSSYPSAFNIDDPESWTESAQQKSDVADARDADSE